MRVTWVQTSPVNVAFGAQNNKTYACKYEIQAGAFKDVTELLHLFIFVFHFVSVLQKSDEIAYQA